MDLSIIIVSWNVKDKLRENLRALFDSDGDFSFGVFVVDNNSEDGTVEMIKKEFPQVAVIINSANLGFAKANNQVLKQVDTPYVLLLNPDMRVRKDTLMKMFNWMKNNPQATVATCELMETSGATIRQVRRFPTVWDQLAIILKSPHIFPGILNRYIRADFDYRKAARVDSIRGGFMFINWTAIKELPLDLDSTLPYFDERYFLWFEEVDWCRQIKKAGGQIWYTSVAQCFDYVGQSFKQLPRGRAQRIFRASQLAYFKKWHPVWQYRLLKLVWPIGLFFAWLIEKTHLKTQKYRT